MSELVDVLRSLDVVVEALKDRLGDFVVVGGTAAALLITDPGAKRIRATDDVDIVVSITTKGDYDEFQKVLRTEYGFKHDMEGPICRFIVNGVKVDVMPLEGKILGFKNDWYARVVAQPEPYTLESSKIIQLVTAPLFLCTKIEAFMDRGEGDYLFSSDMEDIIAVIDGRSTLVDECRKADVDVREYIAKGMSDFLAESRFDDALQGHLSHEPEKRVDILRDRCKQLADLK